MKIASLFDGIGGALLCAERCGIEAVWSSEIEPFPIKVTEYHFPHVKHLGDITKIKGDQVEPVDIIIGGSPCQDLSVAGLRKGMKHSDFGDEETTRSGLFMEQIRIVKEMRNASKLRIERRCNTEMGVGSSADNSVAERGVYSDDGTNGGETIKPRFMVWENVPGAFSSNKGEDFRIVLEETARIKDKTVSIPRPNGGKWSNAGVIVGDGFSIAWRTVDAQFWGVPQRRRRIYLVADFGGQSAPEILFEREGVRGDIKKSGTEGKGTAGNVEGCIRSAGFKGNQGSKAGGIGFQIECAPTVLAGQEGHIFRADTTVFSLDTTDPNPSKNQGGIAIVQPVICLQGNGIDRADTAGCNGKGWTENVCYTLNTIDRPAVCFDMTHANDVIREAGDIVPTLQARMGTGGNQIPLVSNVFREGGFGDYVEGEFGTLKKSGGVLGGWSETFVKQDTVRRLTPLECERLQGYPDGWTDIPGASDSARYKALGNSFAIPNISFVIQRCVEMSIEEM